MNGKLIDLQTWKRRNRKHFKERGNSLQAYFLSLIRGKNIIINNIVNIVTQNKPKRAIILL